MAAAAARPRARLDLRSSAACTRVIASASAASSPRARGSPRAPRARRAARDAGLGHLGDASFVVQGRRAPRRAPALRPPRGLRRVRQPPRLLVELRPGGVPPRARRRDGRGVLGPQRRPRAGAPSRAEAARVRDRGPLVARRPLRARPDLVDLPLRLLDLRALRRRAVALARGELARRLGPLLLDALLLRPDGAEVARARRRALRLGAAGAGAGGTPRRADADDSNSSSRAASLAALIASLLAASDVLRFGRGGGRSGRLGGGRAGRAALPLRGRCGLVPHDGRGAARASRAHGGRRLGRRRRGERRGLVPYHGRRAARVTVTAPRDAVSL